MEVGDVYEPKQSHAKRMLWYYERIIDCLVANPQMKIKEIAAELNRSTGQISMIINSDMFKAAYEQRRLQFTKFHDGALVHKTAAVATATLDAILATLEKKKDLIPLSQLQSLNNSAMEKLGYGVPKSGPQVLVQQNNNAQVVLPPHVTREDLEVARMAVRQAQQNRLAAPPMTMLPAPTDPLLEVQDRETEDAS